MKNTLICFILIIILNCSFNNPFEVHQFCTVTFEKNGGDTDSVPLFLNIVKGGIAATLPSIPPLKNGFRFLGWYRSEDNGGTLTSIFNENSIVNQDSIVYAGWEIILPNTVIFDENGGDGKPVPSSIVVPDKTQAGTLPVPPDRNGYTFLEWNTSRNGSGTNFTTNTVVYASMTVYAQWTPNKYRINFDKNTGETDAIPAHIDIDFDTIIGSFPESPEKTGYIFDGWNTQSDGSGLSVSINTIIKENITVYAQWRVKKCIITFNPNYQGSTDLPVSKTVDFGTSFNFDQQEKPLRDGFYCVGWNEKVDGSGKNYTGTIIIESDIQLFALWDVIKVQVIFDALNSETPQKVEINYGSLIPLPPSFPLKDGYDFSGWFNDALYTDMWDFSQDVVTKEVKLYAKWRNDTSIYGIGDIGPALGYIFYINENYKTDGWRYLEASSSDYGIDSVWSSSDHLVGNTESSIGKGKSNTAMVLEKPVDEDSAALLCDDYINNGFDDWFLPSLDELSAMYTALKLTGIGGFENRQYWSSTENSDSYSYFFDFSIGNKSFLDKKNVYKVRAARSF